MRFVEVASGIMPSTWLHGGEGYKVTRLVFPKNPFPYTYSEVVHSNQTATERSRTAGLPKTESAQSNTIFSITVISGTTC